MKVENYSSSLVHNKIDSSVSSSDSYVSKEFTNTQQDQTQNVLKEPDNQELTRKVESMNDFLKPMKTSLKFKLHERLEEYYVQVVDSTTEEVIREVPAKKLLDMYAEMTELLSIAIDKKI